MNWINLALLLVGVALLIAYLRKHPLIFKNKKYQVKQDPAAQALYNKKHEQPVQKLTLQERIELSWKFLYEITDIILDKFSKEDRDDVHALGHQMLDAGMRYEHVVDLGIRQDIVKDKFVNQEQNKENQKDLTQVSR